MNPTQRRNFLKLSTLATACGALAACGGGSQSAGAAEVPVSGNQPQPTPDPRQATPPAPVPAPAPAPAPAPGANTPRVAVTALRIDTPGASAVPFTVGQVFKRGDVPSGQAVTSSLSKFQAEVRNRWDDGSVRYAVLSGQTPAGVVEIFRGGTPFVAAHVTEPEVDVEVSFSGIADAASSPIAGGSFSALLSSAREAGFKSWTPSRAHKVREILGPVMSEFHYFVPTADIHTHVWFYVRAYRGGATEVETVVENGWLLVAAPGRRDYGITLSILGTQRYRSSGLAHYHHTRWSRVDWVGADPQVTPQHDVQYLQGSGLLPKLAVTSLNPSAYAARPSYGRRFNAWTRALAEQPTPFELANTDPSLGSGGYSDAIGLLPVWDMTYLAEGHASAYWAIQGNQRAAGRFCLHYRDEATGRPFRGSQHLTLGVHNTAAAISDNSSNNPVLTPAPSGGAPSTNWFYTHGPAIGYTAYLLSGRWTALEELQFHSATFDLVPSAGWTYQGYRLLRWTGQNREHAWVFRTRTQAAIAWPERLNDIPLTSGADFDQRIEAMGRVNCVVDYCHATYVANAPITTPSNAPPRALSGNAFGLYYQDGDYDGTADGEYTFGGMMQAYNALAIMWAFSTGALDNPRLGSLAAFSARLAAGPMGGAPGAAAWDWRLLGWYQFSFGSGGFDQGSNMLPASLRSSWDAQWTFLNTRYTWQSGRPDSQPADNLLRTSGPTGVANQFYIRAVNSFDASSSVFDAMVAVVAFAHEISEKVEVPGAEMMAQRFYSSSTWTNSLSGSFKEMPLWAVKSRRL